MDRRFPSLPGRLDAGRVLIAFGLLVIGLTWALFAWDLREERSRILGVARLDTANLARAFEEHFLRTVTGLDQTLLYLKSEYARDPEGFDLNSSIANNVILKRVSVQIARIDADGFLADSNVPNFTRVDLSDREHFRVHKDGSVGDTLFVSKPVLGRASGKWSVQLARRLDDAAGGFAGILVISLDPRYLSQFYGSFDLGEGGRVVLVGRDGVVRAGSGADDLMGERITDVDLLDRIFSDRVGPLDLTGPFDATPRLTTFRVIGDLPLALLVGRSEADVLAPHRDMERNYLLGGMALTAILLSGLVLIYSLVRRQQRIASDLTEKKAELVANRERLKRYVADLERIAEVSAHDLQEPLRRVVAYAQLLAKHAENVLDEEGRGYVTQVVEGACRIRKLVKDLEAFVGVDHLPPVTALVGAEEAIGLATQLMAEDLEAAEATLVVDPLPKVAADTRTLAEIFVQLIGNALKYKASGRKPLVHVSARRDGARVVFSVRDNGVGIERRHWAGIFEIFRRLYGIDGESGTGIGLAIVRRSVERLGGRVWIESSVVGEGTAFAFSLPAEVLQRNPASDQEVQAA